MAPMRSHPAARLEDVWNRLVGGVLHRRGWRRVVLPYTGYGNRDMLRVLGRVVLVPGTHPRATGAHDVQTAQDLDRRGWRSFFLAAEPDAQVTVRVPDGGPDGGRQVVTDRSGYLDVRIPNPGLGPGWHRVLLDVGQSPPAVAPLLVVDTEPTVGLVSDIDDTVIRTWLPRPLIAAYNTFVVRERTRSPVPGMADLYRRVLARHPGAPTVYVSTGAWNAAGALRRFLERNGFPDGPMLLTDWGPTNTGWFRSGPAHKRACLQALAEDFPAIRWLLVGDDGQHDPGLYAGFARSHPERVYAIAIRQLTATEQVLAHGTATERLGQDSDSVEGAAPEVRAPDGAGLARELARLDLL